MKKNYLSIFCLFTSLLVQAQGDAVEKANITNDHRAGKQIVNSQVADFLVQSADARMMDAQEGTLAVSKGTTKDVRAYGRLMQKDQAMLLRNIKSLAVARRIKLPSSISKDKQEGRADLSKETGRDFDKKFMNMMKIDHRRDIRLFKAAMKLEDTGIRAFAKKYLPLLEAHLQKIEALQQGDGDN